MSLARSTAVTAVLACIVIILGCMSITIGGRTTVDTTSEDGMLIQEGETQVGAGAERDVFYPIPYASPPNLEIDSTFNHYQLIDQKEDHFRVRNTSNAFCLKCEWKARGLKGSASVAPFHPAELTVPEPQPPKP